MISIEKIREEFERYIDVHEWENCAYKIEEDDDSIKLIMMVYGSGTTLMKFKKKGEK